MGTVVERLAALRARPKVIRVEPSSRLLALHGQKGKPGYILMHPMSTQTGRIGTAIFQLFGQPQVEPLFPGVEKQVKAGKPIIAAALAEGVAKGLKPKLAKTARSAEVKLDGKVIGSVAKGSSVYVPTTNALGGTQPPIKYIRTPAGQWFQANGADTHPVVSSMVSAVELAVDNGKLCPDPEVHGVLEARGHAEPAAAKTAAKKAASVPPLTVKGVFQIDADGKAKPFSGAVAIRGSMTQIENRIKKISQEFGDGKVLGRHPESMSVPTMKAWLDAWFKGDMARVYELDKSVEGQGVSPLHPGAPGNQATHTIEWQVKGTPSIKVLGKSIKVSQARAELKKLKAAHPGQSLDQALQPKLLTGKEALKAAGPGSLMYPGLAIGLKQWRADHPDFQGTDVEAAVAAVEEALAAAPTPAAVKAAPAKAAPAKAAPAKAAPAKAAAPSVPAGKVTVLGKLMTQGQIRQAITALEADTGTPIKDLLAKIKSPLAWKTNADLGALMKALNEATPSELQGETVRGKFLAALKAARTPEAPTVPEKAPTPEKTVTVLHVKMTAQEIEDALTVLWPNDAKMSALEGIDSPLAAPGIIPALKKWAKEHPDSPQGARAKLIAALQEAQRGLTPGEVHKPVDTHEQVAAKHLTVAGHELTPKQAADALAALKGPHGPISALGDIKSPIGVDSQAWMTTLKEIKKWKASHSSDLNNQDALIAMLEEALGGHPQTDAMKEAVATVAPHPSKKEAQEAVTPGPVSPAGPQKHLVAGVAVTRDELENAIKALEAAPGPHVLPPLSKTNNPLAKADYKTAAAKEKELQPVLKVKQAFITHLKKALANYDEQPLAPEPLLPKPEPPLPKPEPPLPKPKPVSPAGPKVGVYTWRDPAGGFPTTLKVFGDGSAITSSGQIKQTMTADAVLEAFASGDVVDAFGNTIALPGQKTQKFWVFAGNKAATLEQLKKLQADIAGWEPDQGPKLSTYIKPVIGTGSNDLVQNYMATHDLTTPLAAINKLITDLIHADETEQTPDTLPVGMPEVNTSAPTVSTAFTFDEHGWAVPYGGSLAVGDTPSAILAKIHDISQEFGDGQVVGQNADKMSLTDRSAWLRAWFSGDMVRVYELDASYGYPPKTHPGHPANEGTHKIVWKPAVAGEIPAGQKPPGEWSATATEMSDAEIDNYLIAAQCAYPQWLSSKRAWVAAHLSGDKLVADRLSLRAQGAALSDKPPNYPAPKHTDLSGPKKKPWEIEIENGWAPSDWPSEVCKAFLADHGVELTSEHSVWAQAKDLYAAVKSAETMKLLGKPTYAQMLEKGVTPANWPDSMLDSYLADYPEISVAPDASHVIKAMAVEAKINQLDGAKDAAQAVEDAKLVFTLDGNQEVLSKGLHDVHMVTDQHGGRWVFKPPASGGAWRSEAEHTASVLAQAWGFRTAESQLGELNGQAGQFQRRHDAYGDLKTHSLGDLTQRQLIDVAQEHLLDWALDNNDTHGGNMLLLNDGGAVGIDKGRAFRRRQLSAGPDPKKMNPYTDPKTGKPILIYAELYERIENGDIDKETVDAMYKAVIARARKMQGMSDDTVREAATTALANRPESDLIGGKAAMIEGLVKRKNNLVADMDHMWTGIYQRAGLDKPALAQRPRNALGQQLHQGLESEGLMDEVGRTRSFGTPAFVAGDHIEDGHVQVWQERRADGGFNVRGEFTLLGDNNIDALRSRLHSLLDGSNVSALPKGWPIREQDYHTAIVGAARAVSTHSKGLSSPDADPDKWEEYQVKRLQRMEEARQEMVSTLDKIEQLKKDHVEGDPKWSELEAQIGSLDAYQKMAAKYLGYIDDVKQMMIDNGVSTSGQFARFEWTPPSKPEDVEAPKVKVQLIQATRAMSGQMYSQYNITDDGTLNLSQGALKGEYEGQQGEMYLVTLPTGETIEFRNRAQTNTKLSQQGLMRFTIADTSQAEASFGRIKAFLSTQGVALDAASEQDLELLYWRSLEGVMRNRKDAKPGAAGGKYQKFWDAVSDDLRRAGGQAEIEMWRNAFATITSRGQIDQFVAEGGHLPRLDHFDLANPTQGNGRPYWERFDLTPSMWRQQQMLGSAAGDGGVDSLPLTGGAHSTDERIRVLGAFIRGASSEEDQARGSAGFAFMSQNRENIGENKYGKFTIYYSPRLLTRTSSYGWNSDSFGRLSNRATDAAFDWKGATQHGSENNETLAKNGVSLLDDIEVIIVDDVGRRTELINSLKKRGVTVIRGVPVEQRIVPRSQAKAALARARAAWTGPQETVSSATSAAAQVDEFAAHQAAAGGNVSVAGLTVSPAHAQEVLAALKAGTGKVASTALNNAYKKISLTPNNPLIMSAGKVGAAADAWKDAHPDFTGNQRQAAVAMLEEALAAPTGAPTSELGKVMGSAAHVQELLTIAKDTPPSKLWDAVTGFMPQQEAETFAKAVNKWRKDHGLPVSHQGTADATIGVLEDVLKEFQAPTGDVLGDLLAGMPSMEDKPVLGAVTVGTANKIINAVQALPDSASYNDVWDAVDNVGITTDDHALLSDEVFGWGEAHPQAGTAEALVGVLQNLLTKAGAPQAAPTGAPTSEPATGPGGVVTGYGPITPANVDKYLHALQTSTSGTWTPLYDIGIPGEDAEFLAEEVQLWKSTHSGVSSKDALIAILQNSQKYSSTAATINVAGYSLPTPAAKKLSEALKTSDDSWATVVQNYNYGSQELKNAAWGTIVEAVIAWKFDHGQESMPSGKAFANMLDSLVTEAEAKTATSSATTTISPPSTAPPTPPAPAQAAATPAPAQAAAAATSVVDPPTVTFHAPIDPTGKLLTGAEKAAVEKKLAKYTTKPADFDPTAPTQTGDHAWYTAMTSVAYNPETEGDDWFAVRTYQSMVAERWNDALRKGKPVTGLSAQQKAWVEKAQPLLDDLMDRSSLTHAVKVYRGIKPFGSSAEWSDYMGKLTVGNVIQDNGYASTSTDDGLAKNWSSGGVVFEVEVPAGARGVAPTQWTTRVEHEKEILLPRGTRFEVVSAPEKQADGHVLVKLRVVP